MHMFISLVCVNREGDGNVVGWGRMGTNGKGEIVDSHCECNCAPNVQTQMSSSSSSLALPKSSSSLPASAGATSM